ncbi:MAG TPA: STAS domain-containing protein [Candidatus Ozemobacteraceae bacterium]
MNIEAFSIQTERRGEVTIISLRGPLNEDAGRQLVEQVVGELAAGRTRFVVDFGNAVAITSPCVASVLEIAEKIVDEKGGRLIVSGLTDLNVKVFEMVGILLYAESCRTLQDAEVQASA